MEQHAVTPDTTVGDVVAAYPATMPMLESLGIDYCCGGKRPLAEAARDANIPVATVLAVLRTTIAQAQQAPTPARDWQTAPLEELMDYIIAQHHAFMHRELPRISQLLERVTHAHGTRHGDVLSPLAETFAALRQELEAHLADEEERTFPLIRRLLAGQRDAEVREAIGELEHEHDAAGEALAHLRTLTHNYQVPTDACTSYCALYDALQAMERDLHAHIHLENNILFPRTRALLAEQGEQAA